MFKKKFKIIQKRMDLHLEEIRATLSHRGDRGSSAESILKDFLKEYLPPYNRIGEGEIIDTKGNQSTQLDIVITNDGQPFLNDLSGPELFIIEGVSCVGEVKTKLNSQDVNTLIESCITYKKIKPVIQRGTMTCSNPEDTMRFVNHRPYFIFAYESQLTLQTIHQKITEHYALNEIPLEHQIDAIFCLDRGAIWNFGNGNGAYHFITDDGSKLPGIHITNDGKDGVLFDFMTWLSYAMPKINMPSSPIELYLKP
ncbi:DUF6602 domain-containing protein [Shewanella kaireitica]|uniref:DUF6602 domain-containing protein n=1 Tax=Shewanella kaireitica TaxID=212021 RepID=UPI00200C3E88|nr:DUF6602 domain-containing protein [Shewanella kaireitica]MCL1093301.1 hypothetical protein [Shewanella kaireitica]